MMIWHSIPHFEISYRELNREETRKTSFVHSCIDRFYNIYPPKSTDDNLILLHKSDFEKLRANQK